MGDRVYLSTDVEQLPRIITGIFIRQLGVIYELAQGEESSNHYDFEFSLEPDLVMKSMS